MIPNLCLFSSIIYLCLLNCGEKANFPPIILTFIYTHQMKNLNFLKLFLGTMFLIVTTTFVGCVDDNDDTEAPFLEVSPTSLIFTTDGVPAEGSQSSFEISTNRHWTATVKDDKSWVTLSAAQGDGPATIQVSIPEGINDEANIDIQISNKVGPLATATVKITSGSVVPTEVIYHETVGTTAVASPFPYVDAYTGWTKTGTGAANVTYSGQKATVRASGLANTDAYDGASGPNVVFFGTLPADFVISDIALTAGQTNLKLTFGASYSFKAEGSTEYDNTFDPSKFTLSLSADGTNWVPVTYTKNNGDEKSPYWVLATSDFTLKQPTAKLYIKFTALAASAIRLDDITLSTGNGGGQVIDLGNVTPPPSGETTPITIPELIAMMTTSQTPVDATADRTLEAVVQSDTEAGNYTVNNLVLATEGATTAGNGITLFGSQVDAAKLGLTKGDKVKVTLYQNLAKTVNYNGMYEVTGAQTDEWAKVEKIGTAAITPTVITADKLAEYQGMTVTIENATPENAGIWGSETTHTFTAGGVSFAVFCKASAPAFANQPFTKTVSNITGLAAVYKNNSQLVPRNIEDVIGFSSNDPMIVKVTPSSVNFPATGGTQTLEVEIMNQGANTLSASGLSGILLTTLNGTTVTVTSTENTSTDAVNQTLTISLSNGNSVDVPVTVAGISSGNEKTLTMTAAQIIENHSGDLELNNSGYGKQAVADPSTWYKWNDSGIEFAGARVMIGKTPDSVIGMIQMQGNASTATNQGLITNNTSLGKIKSITLSLGDSSTESYTYSPAFNVYGGVKANDLTTPITSSGDKFNPTFDFSGGDFSHFTIKNNLAGVLYISKIVIVYE